MAEGGWSAPPVAPTDDDYAAMAGLNPAIWHLSSELHALVAGFAGRLPDALVVQLRRWIGAGDLQGVTEAIALSALTLGLPVTPQEAHAIATLPAAFDRATDVPEGLIVADAPTEPSYSFAAGSPAERFGHGPADPVDRALFQALYQSPDAVALRRAVRAATDREPERRVYLFEVEPGTVLWQVTAAAQEALEAVGEAQPQVEVYRTDREPTAYQHAALRVATPLWVRPSLPRRIGTSFGQGQPRPGRPTVFEWFQWEPEVWDDLTTLHRMLRQHTVDLPADPLNEARRLLSTGDLADLVAVLADAAGDGQVELTPAEIEVLRGIPAKAERTDVDLGALDRAVRADPARASRLPARRIVAPPEGLEDDEYFHRSRVVLRQEAALQPGVRKVWWSWVVAGEDLPVPVLLAEVEPGFAAWDVSYVLVSALRDYLGLPSDADAFWSGTDLPDLYREALASAELLWSVDDPDAEFTGGIRVAETYDAADDRGQPLLAPDRPRIDDPAERRRLVARMDAGEVLVLREAWLAPNILDPARERAVPVDYRTDGEWIWNDAATFYLEEYGIVPSAPLLEHLRAMERGAI